MLLFSTISSPSITELPALYTQDKIQYISEIQHTTHNLFNWLGCQVILYWLARSHSVYYMRLPPDLVPNHLIPRNDLMNVRSLNDISVMYVARVIFLKIGAIGVIKHNALQISWIYISIAQKRKKNERSLIKNEWNACSIRLIQRMMENSLSWE